MAEQWAYHLSQEKPQMVTGQPFIAKSHRFPSVLSLCNNIRRQKKNKKPNESADACEGLLTHRSD